MTIFLRLNAVAGQSAPVVAGTVDRITFPGDR